MPDEPTHAAPGKPAQLVFWLVWYALSFMAVLLLPTQSTGSTPFWGQTLAQLMVPFVAGHVFLLGSLVVAILARRGSRVMLWGLPVAASLAAVWAAIVFSNRPAIRPTDAGFLLAAAAALPLAVAPYAMTRARLGLRLTALAALTLLDLGLVTGPALRAFYRPEQRSISTALNTVAITLYRGLAGPQPVSGGAIEPDGDALLLVTGDGAFFRILPTPAGLEATRLALTAPLNRAAFIAHRPDIFRVTDLLLGGTGADRTVYVAHQYWNAEGKCLTLRISTAPFDTTPDAEGASPGRWRTVYETQPCLAVVPPFDDTETGGRLAWLDRDLLLTIGDHGFSGLQGVALAQDPAGDYGKVLRIDPSGGRAIYTSGHRNPQGLWADANGEVWETEHGPQGGDEINRLEPGRNYGWPQATYGTQYGTHAWPLSADGRHERDGFTEPAYAFVPSIGVSNVIRLRSPLFPEWRDDLLIGALRQGGLFRARTSAGHVVYVEAVPIARRVRDLAEGADGRLYLWTDEGQIGVLGPGQPFETAAFDRCRTCHEPAQDEPAAAPPLADVLGRAVASAPGYDYSPALKAFGGRWTEARLDQFLSDPDALVPGSRMNAGRVPDPAQRAAVLRYLRSH
jgi:glucose/arabinose dehydrogenase/cytochrome c2